MWSKINSSALVASILFAFAEIALLFFTPREDTLQLVTVYSAMCAAYFVLYKEVNSIRSAAFLGVLFRGIAWLAFPALSDDIYRFIWDGALVLGGENPYLHTPTAFFSQHLETPFEDLYPLLNSSAYYSVYPPLMQGFMAFGALAANDHYLAALIIKLPLFIAEIATIWLLPQVLMRFQISPKYSVLYFLNPLIIVDVLANAHYELLAICFFLYALNAMQLKRFIQAGSLMALSVGIKLVPLIIIPYLLKGLKTQQRLLFGAGLLICSSIIFIPLMTAEVLEHFSQSLQLYFQSFEFNASIYFLFRWFGELAFGYNIIAYLGPILALVAIGIMAFLFVRQKPQSISCALNAGFWALTAYLFLTTTVHPWYLSLLLFLSLFNRVRYPIIWSMVVILSYAAYQTTAYEEQLWLVAIEYLIVAVALLRPGWVKRLFRLSPLKQ